MRLVNLFVIGAMKSGSTTLHEHLAGHPGIHMSSEKEPGYFVPELWGDRDPVEYPNLFAGAASREYLGESSTHYAKLPRYTGVAERIHRYNPAARIVYIMRHPVERSISHFLHAVRDLASGGETRDLVSAMKEVPDYGDFSDYARQLKPYLGLFGRDQVYTLVFEEMADAPLEQVNGLLAWLGLEPLQRIEGGRRANSRPEAYKRVRGTGLLNRLRYSPAWAHAAPLVPKWARALGNQLAEEVTTDTISPEQRAEVHRLLGPRFARMTDELAAMTGRNYDLWEFEG